MGDEVVKRKKKKINVLAHVIHEVEPELFHLVEHCIEAICIVGERICVGNGMDDVEAGIRQERRIDQYM